MDIQILKSNGELELFDRSKLEQSLKKAGASIFTVDEIVNKISKGLKNGTSTHHIYKKAFSYLNKRNPKTAIKYSIKRSIISLGPTGFPFEKFLAELMTRLGYKVSVGETLKGSCINHETDIVARNNNEIILTEVKFHNDIGTKTDTKVALYVKARFDDLKETKFDFEDSPQSMTKGLLITNTKFTDNAIKYGECAGVNMISWDYPNKGNLYDLIDQTKLHPITCLESLSKSQKKALIDRGIVACADIRANTKIMDSVGLSHSKKGKVLAEIAMLCN